LGIPGVTTFLTFGRLQDLPNQKRALKKGRKPMKQSFLIGWLSMENHGRFVSWISQSKSSVSWFYLFS
jgi:hypothetical protein